MIYAGHRRLSRLTLFDAGLKETRMLMDVPRRDLNATRVLSLDATGRILDWMSWQDAVCLYVRGAVAWTLGDPCLTVHGGHNRLPAQSHADAAPDRRQHRPRRRCAIDPAPALTNIALFARDRMLCLYCGDHFSAAS